MAQISAKLVKELRDQTGAGMGDCKKALVENDGDMGKAVEYLRKKGAAAAAKRQDRSADEGLIIAITSEDRKSAAIVEINCETDFVARSEEFGQYAGKVAEAVLDESPENNDDLMKVELGGNTIENLHNDILAKFSEKIKIRRFKKINSDGYIECYNHAGNKLGVLLDVSASNPTEKAKEVIRDVAMQVAAMNPAYIDKNTVPKDVIEKEQEIYKEAAVQEGKKPEIAEKIAMGKLNKYFQEQCLLEQQFVKDSKMAVKDVLKEISEELGGKVNINGFVRFYLGETLED